MPVWTTVSALVSNVARSIGTGYRFTPSTVIGEQDTQTLLSNIDAVLQRTDRMVEKHKRIYSSFEYETFLAENRVLHAQFVDESRYQSKLEAGLAERGLSSSEVRKLKESARARVADLLNVVDAYENKVVSASQRARTLDIPSFPDEIAPAYQDEPVIETVASSTVVAAASDPEQPARPPSPQRNVKASCIRSYVSLMSRRDIQIGCLPTVETNNLAKPPAFQNKELQFAVMHTPLDGEEGVSSGKRLYRRTVVIEYGEEVLEIPDSEPHELEENRITLNADVLFELQDVIQKWISDILAKEID
ncbi:hypothetical protein RhiJN_00219 [Ceratobasidium sp. AG-Ba]|nr:hypothetical protein RhiJN_00219 [Ceratobasidium sp. AG-Ba]QRW01252.1 hypothetical protein RhiLY_00249 [Ceratobasidium sp. AG-Ba]